MGSSGEVVCAFELPSVGVSSLIVRPFEPRVACSERSVVGEAMFTGRLQEEIDLVVAQDRNEEVSW